MRFLTLLLCCVVTVTSCQKDIKKKDIGESEILVQQDSCYCYLPNAFSPDGNQINDVLRPLTRNVINDGYNFTVRDKRQKVLFTSTTLGEYWEASNQSEGIYIVTVKGSFSCGNTFEEHTCVNLIKDCISKKLDVDKLIFESMGSFVDQYVTVDAYPSGEKICDRN